MIWTVGLRKATRSLSEVTSRRFLQVRQMCSHCHMTAEVREAPDNIRLSSWLGELLTAELPSYCTDVMMGIRLVFLRYEEHAFHQKTMKLFTESWVSTTA